MPPQSTEMPTHPPDLPNFRITNYGLRRYVASAEIAAQIPLSELESRHHMSKHAIALATALLALGGCAALPPTLAQMQAAGANPPVSSDRARIYVFRNFRTGGPPTDPVVYIDGRAAGISTLGSVFERDVPPGPHTITTDPKHPDYSEITSLATAPGSTVYLAVDDNWVNDETQGSRIPIFSIAPINPFIGRSQAERLPFEDGGAAIR